MGNITGDFIGNYANISATAESGATYANANNSGGGAIYNYSGTMGNITGDFINNYVKTNIGTTFGGAIFSTTANPNWDYELHAKHYWADDTEIGLAYEDGGADTPQIVIKDNKFEGNKALSTDGNTYGGAIALDSGKFVTMDNYTEISLDGDDPQVAIDNITQKFDDDGYDTDPTFGTVNNLISNTQILNNSSETTNGDAYGGAISANIGDFLSKGKLTIYQRDVKWYDEDNDEYTDMGQYYTIDYDWENSIMLGGYDDGNNIIGTAPQEMNLQIENATISGNIAKSTNGNAYGGAIAVGNHKYTPYYNEYEIVSGDEIIVSSDDYDYDSFVDKSFKNQFKNQYYSFLYPSNGIEQQSFASSLTGFNTDKDLFANINVPTNLTIINSTFTGNKAQGVEGYGGAIYNAGGILTVVDSTFTNNEATTAGGAIYNAVGATTNLISLNDNTSFTGNTANSLANDLFNAGIVNINANGGQNITFNGSITGNNGNIYINNDYTYTTVYENGDTLEIDTDNDAPTGGNYIFNNTVSGNTVTLNNGATVTLGKNGTNYGTLDLVGLKNDDNGGLINAQNQAYQDNKLGEVNLNSDIKINIDTDFSNSILKSDTFEGTIGDDNSGQILISKVYAMGDTITEIPLKINVIKGAIMSIVDLANDFEVTNTAKVIPANYLTTYSHDSTGGYLNLAFSDLTHAVSLDVATKAYTMTDNENVTANLGTLNGTSLVINGGTNKITGQGTTGGITVGNGKSLTINNVSEFSGFGTAVIVSNGGNLKVVNSTLTNNTTDIANAGTTEFAGGATVNSITGNGGLNVTSGTNTVNTTLQQGTLAVSSGATLTNNSTTATVGGGSNAGTINGTGNLSNTGTFNNTGDGTISQNKITNSGIFTSLANKLTATNGIENTNTLNLTGGENTNKITGTGGITNFSNTATNSATIDQNVTNTGALTNNAKITGTITNNGTSASITSSADNLNGNVSNTGTLTLNGGSTHGTISGTGGTTVINSGTVTLGHAITGNSIELNSGATLGASTGADISGASSLVAKGGTLDLTYDNAVSDVNIGNVDLSQGNMNLIIDTDLSGTGSADRISGSATGSGNIIISEINVKQDATSMPVHGVNVVQSDGTLISHVRLATDPMSVTHLTESYMATYNNSTGNLDFDSSDLANAVASNAAERVYSMADGQDENVYSDLGAMGGATGANGAVLNIAGNGKNINGSASGSKVGGITVQDGQTLAVGNINTFNGFTTAITTNAPAATTTGGTANLENVVFTGNDVDVDNNGTMNLTGNNEFNDAVTGATGNTNVKSGTTTFNGTVNQDKIAIANGATAEFNNTTNSDIENSGTATNNNIVTGNVVNTGDNAKFDNDGTINGNVNNSKDFDNQGGTVSGTVTNSSSFDNKGGTVTGDVNNNGGSFDNTNNGSITGKVTNAADFDNQNGSITGDVDNSGTFDNENGTISGNVKNSGTGVIDTNIDNIGGNVDNNAILNISGGTNSNQITGSTGTTNIKGTVKNTNTINQNEVNVTANNSLENDGTLNATTLNNNGTFTNDNGRTATIGTLNNNSDIDNNGNFIVNTGATNTSNITGDGTLTNNGAFDNTNGTVSQKSINNTGNITTNSENLIATDGITNDGQITFNSGSKTVSDINGTATGNVVLDTNDNFIVNNKIEGTQLTLQSSTMYLGSNGDISQATSFNVNGGAINVAEGNITETNLGNVNLNGTANMAIDFNLDNMKSDSFIANITNNGGKFNISNVNVMGNTLKDNFKLHLGDTTNLGRDNVSSDSFSLPTIMTPIRKIAGRVEDGYLMYAPTGNSYKDYNSAVFAAPIAAQLGGYLSQLNSYDEAFRNLDMKMLMTREERQAYKMANRYASVDGAPKVFSPTYLPEKESAGWIRPYTSFEKVDLKGGTKVNNIMYGSFFGGDSPMYQTKNGWDYQWSLYAGYNGSHQTYDGNSIYQNGGNIGATGIWYKGDFFTALTANVGASVAEAHTMYGSENFPMLMTGVASKTGYNWELAHGKFIIQPSYMMSYTFVNTFDYTNAAGARISSDPLNAINITPGVKFIGNLKNGWQPYASVQMVWNIMDKTDFKAANIGLPDTSVKPYVQYGIGIQKRWGERFTGFFQTMIRNGGRNGVALSAGFRWALGKDKTKENKAQGEIKPNKTVIKPAKNNTQKSKNIARYNELINGSNSQQTQDKKIIKQLTPAKDSNLKNTSITPMQATISKI